MTTVESPAQSADEVRKLRLYLHVLAQTTKSFANEAGIDPEEVKISVDINAITMGERSLQSILDEVKALTGDLFNVA
ncbi:hypothetical protein [Alcaligenes aquatilis]|uniref:hypothetical protein n=1 Tax=Alcaligenes aquatilis TaxID=323284 RepID=UPI00360EB5B7